MLPIKTDKVGEPAVKSSNTTSLNVALINKVSPAFNSLTDALVGLVLAPTAPLMATLFNIGATVSRLNEGEMPAKPKFPAASS